MRLAEPCIPGQILFFNQCMSRRRDICLLVPSLVQLPARMECCDYGVSGWNVMTMVFVTQNLSGPGLDADILLPPLATLQAHDFFELDFKLSCPGSRDTDCPVWDHTVQLFVCCHDPSGHADPCASCEPTVWTKPYSSSAASRGEPDRSAPPPQGVLGQPVQISSSLGLSSSQCGRELGRWITPFRLASLPHYLYLLAPPRLCVCVCRC